MRTMALRKSKYAKLYKWVIEDIRERYEIRVRHKKLETAFGHYDFEDKIITVDREIAGTVFGLWVIFHELIHYIDELKGRYPNFYKKILYGKTKGLDVEKIVWQVEWHCCAEAKKYLERLGIEIHNQFCDREYLKKYILPVWVSYYLVKK
jgi:hypothetical protein